MSHFEELLFTMGSLAVISALVMIVRPQSLTFETRSNHAARLRELDEGAEEAFFEERRTLETYKPRLNISNANLRMIGFVLLALGVAAIAMSL